MIVADGVLPPGPDEVKGMPFFGDTAEEAEQIANAHLMVESVNQPRVQPTQESGP